MTSLFLVGVVGGVINWIDLNSTVTRIPQLMMIISTKTFFTCSHPFRQFAFFVILEKEGRANEPMGKVVVLHSLQKLTKTVVVNSYLAHREEGCIINKDF